MEPLLSVSLSVGFPSKPKVLDNLKFDILPGEIVGFVGHSGCGKEHRRIFDPQSSSQPDVSSGFCPISRKKPARILSFRDARYPREEDCARPTGRSVGAEPASPH